MTQREMAEQYLQTVRQKRAEIERQLEAVKKLEAECVEALKDEK